VSLAKEYEISAIGYDASGIPGVEHIVLAGIPQLSLFEKISRAILSILGLHLINYRRRPDVRELHLILTQNRFDVILANDIETLPVVTDVAGKARIIFDAHEYSPKEFTENFKWRILHGRAKYWLCKRFLPRADQLTTVGTAIRDLYETEFGICGEVIYNAPALNADIRILHPKNTIRIIHHGAALRGRRLELMIEVMRRLPNRYQLDFMLMPSDMAYYSELKHLAAAVPNIRFIPTVPTEQIVTAIAKYDIGLYMLYPSNFNNLMALPNKFFEFVQARLAIFVGPSPEMAAILKIFGNGVAIGDFEPETMANSIQQYSKNEIVRMKKNSARAAKVYCMENERKKLLAIVERLLQSGARET